MSQSQLPIGIKVPPQYICLLHELHNYKSWMFTSKV